MGRSGNCHDHAVAEIFVSSLKRERIRRRRCKTLEDARQDVFDYVEMFYNPVRKQARKGMRSPIEFERPQILKAEGVWNFRGYSVCSASFNVLAKPHCLDHSADPGNDVHLRLTYRSGEIVAQTLTGQVRSLDDLHTRLERREIGAFVINVDTFTALQKSDDQIGERRQNRLPRHL